MCTVCVWPVQAKMIMILNIVCMLISQRFGQQHAATIPVLYKWTIFFSQMIWNAVLNTCFMDFHGVWCVFNILFHCLPPVKTHQAWPKIRHFLSSASGAASHHRLGLPGMSDIEIMKTDGTLRTKTDMAMASMAQNYGTNDPQISDHV